MLRASGELNTASETDRGQSHDREYSVTVIYRGPDLDSDSGDDKDTAGGDMKRREVGEEQEPSLEIQRVEPE